MRPRLRGIHHAAANAIYDHSKPWVTHASIQDRVLTKVHGWREQYTKPIVIDECQDGKRSANDAVFERLPRLAAFLRCAIDIRNVDVAAATARGARLADALGALSEQVGPAAAGFADALAAADLSGGQIKNVVLNAARRALLPEERAALPVLPEPKLSLPGFALAWAMSSATDDTGREGFTTSTLGVEATWVMGEKSRTGS